MKLDQKGTINKILVVTIVVVLVGAGAYLLLRANSNSDEPADSAASADGTSLTAPVPGANVDEMVVESDGETVKAVVTYVDGRFDPASIGPIAPGTIVTFRNESSSTIQVASDDHPAHQDLPGFDSGALSPGDSYDFAFLEVGTWSFHNHLQASETGEIVVGEL